MFKIVKGIQFYCYNKAYISGVNYYLCCSVRIYNAQIKNYFQKCTEKVKEQIILLIKITHHTHEPKA